MIRLHAIAFAVTAALSLAWTPAFALTADDVNAAKFESLGKSRKGPDPVIVKAQALLDRRSVSPGVIDGLDGDNFRKALAQFRRIEELGEGDKLDRKTWEALGGDTSDDIIMKYEITKKDAGYEFVDKIPEDYSKQAKMDRLAYTSALEMHAERFHMGENLLKALNPKVDFKEAGQTIQVVKVEREKPKGKVVRIEADKSTGMVVAYSEDDRVLLSYPATIGSKATPSPEGEHKVTRIAKNPTYHYDPEKNFQQGDNTEKLVLPGGPNNPVGSIWIALSKPTYGIHGTPEPSLISKTSSHGCVRLTNWDAEQLAELISPGVTVKFVD